MLKICLYDDGTVETYSWGSKEPVAIHKDSVDYAEDIPFDDVKKSMEDPELKAHQHQGPFVDQLF